MNRVLIMFDTTEGQTRKIAQAIARRLSSSGLAADVFRAGEKEPALNDYAGIIVAGSVHAGRYQKPLLHWVRKHAQAFGKRPTAFVSVSLGTLQKDDARVTADLAAIVERFCSAAAWKPTMVKHVAGALMYTHYNFITRWLMKRISAKAGGATDTSRDYEYTDWDEVNAFADDFRRRIPAAAA